MCVEHASAIDEPTTMPAYPVDLLRRWKAKQLEEYDQLKQGWILDAKMAQEAIDASFSKAEVVIENSNVEVGGRGGNAPGAGGGGGGAIGRDARAGRGGDGGARRIEGGDSSLPPIGEVTARLIEHLANAREGAYPGAGGGGAGAVGDGAVAGDGGGGGESVSAIVDTTELRQRGLDHVEVTVGQAASGSHLAGQHGASGGDSIMKFVARDGTVLKTIRARGGLGGASGASSLPDEVAELSADDIDQGAFCITTLMPANALDVRDNLAFILGGNWATYPVPTLPFDALWRVMCTARWRSLEGTTPRGLFLSLINPSGQEASCQALTVPTESLQGRFCSWISTIGATLNTEGEWSLRLHSGGYLLAHFDVQVSMPSPGTTP
jgi:hypothetical protein